jgi:hypothetical protein
MITHALSNDPPWLKRAFADLGLQELPGAAAKPRIVEMYRKSGHPEIKSDEVAWCSAAILYAIYRFVWRHLQPLPIPEVHEDGPSIDDVPMEVTPARAAARNRKRRAR